MDFDLSEADAERFAQRISDEIHGYETLDTLSQPDADESLSIRDVDEHDDPHNAYITSFTTEGGDGPLRGVDVAVKDNLAVAGVPMTCGSRVFEGVVPRRNATVVARLVDAGARLVGKTNMDELAYGPTSETSAFGVVTNPADDERVAGGSSSGSAAAVAEGSADLAIGSDTGGSVRIPASFCGVVGFKPSWGAVPRDGFVDLAPTLDHIGTLAPDVETTALGFDVIGGYDARDPSSALARDIPVGSCADGLTDVPDPEELSFGVPAELLSTHVSDHVRERFEETIATLESSGATVESVRLPTVDDAVFVWNAVTNVEFAAALRRTGLPLERPGPFDLSRLDAAAGRQATAGVGFGDIVRERALVGAVLLDRYDGRHYIRARNVCSTLADEFADALYGHDALVAPTMPVVAPKIGERKPHSYDSDDGLDVPLAYNTRPANLAGVPAVTVPDGSDGLPVGVQFLAGRYEDAHLLRVARSFEKIRDA
ncbi:amidase [Haloferax sulfurifontis]|uniref:Glutamyl-tRNA(Gln) amidotransferase n=1 Tax=Haloferax sulfurifontis TaxID=255616 RepID=A0A830DVH4_9EURY|nr:amidase family protein [Haloferax sulfurifontis]GGC66746.1 glutamyl-tRNA(Gln) amidotransferase [Haloferax sulfurifontis]